jgi:hypothetical protein
MSGGLVGAVCTAQAVCTAHSPQTPLSIQYAASNHTAEVVCCMHLAVAPVTSSVIQLLLHHPCAPQLPQQQMCGTPLPLVYWCLCHAGFPSHVASLNRSHPPATAAMASAGEGTASSSGAFGHQLGLEVVEIYNPEELNFILGHGEGGTRAARSCAVTMCKVMGWGTLLDPLPQGTWWRLDQWCNRQVPQVGDTQSSSPLHPFQVPHCSPPPPPPHSPQPTSSRRWRTCTRRWWRPAPPSSLASPFVRPARAMVTWQVGRGGGRRKRRVEREEGRGIPPDPEGTYVSVDVCDACRPCPGPS